MRNPLERLVSAYRDKIATLIPSYEQWRNPIRKKYNISKVDFETYLQWVVDTPNKKLNEHFAPMIELMQPCRVRYNFYGNFKTLSNDMKIITDKLNVPNEYFHDGSRMHYMSTNITSALVEEYYSTVSSKVKKALYKDFRKELDFYFHLFPEERERSIKLLNILTPTL